MAQIILAKESYAIVGACFAVYNEMGHCFTEPVFHECLEIELQHLGIPFLSKPPLKLTYRDQPLTHTFAPDFLCFEKLVLEIKAVSSLMDVHRAQVINYIHTANLDLGLLVNFGSYPNLQWERFLHSRLPKQGSSQGEPPSF